YGFVAGIVKLDDAGLSLSQKSGNNLWRKIQRALGEVLLNLAPYLMKGLSVVGTVAMFMVGGGILIHGLPGGYERIEKLAQGAGSLPAVGKILEPVLPLLLNVSVGILAGALVLLGVNIAVRLIGLVKQAP
ncbi:MAG TPA: DUF808 family protein, partial [Candidatus Limnocylindrales bacterium]|nr:DUF808 family protein [Candidatus Limnocylindrales bacterium]